MQQGETVDWSTDTELDFGNPGTKNADGTPRTARSFITWNTTPFQDALIVDTNLSLWNFHSGNTDCTAQSWTIWDTTAASSSSRWTNQPTWNQQYHSSTQTRGNPSCTATQPAGWINANANTLVQTWSSAKATRGHMGLRAATDDVKAWKRVNSANNTANQPKLSVTYNYRPSDGTDRQAGAPFKSYAGVWAVNTTTPTLRDTFTDPDGDKVNGTFQIYDAATNTPITTPLGEGLVVSDFVASGKPASVTVPAGQLGSSAGLSAGGSSRGALRTRCAPVAAPPCGWVRPRCGPGGAGRLETASVGHSCFHLVAGRDCRGRPCAAQPGCTTVVIFPVPRSYA